MIKPTPVSPRAPFAWARRWSRRIGRAVVDVGVACAAVACTADTALAASTGSLLSHPFAVRPVAMSPQYGRQITPLDQIPQSITLVELLYEATRTLDAGGDALAAMGDAYAGFGAEWKMRMPPKSRRLVDAAAEADDAAALRALEAAWAESDALHGALVARVIEACAATGAPTALDATAQANFRGRIAHRVAFSDGTSLSVDRLPIVTSPCVDLAVALAHPRIRQRVPEDRRATLDALLAGQWPRILAEHRELRRIGFELGIVEARTPIMYDEVLTKAAARAMDDALRAIARLARANLAANLAFADRVEADVGLDAADALRVEVIANACRDGGFASELNEGWIAFERWRCEVESDRTLDAVARDASVRDLRARRHRMVLECAARFRAFLLSEHAFTSGLDGDGASDRALEAALRGDHPFSEGIAESFRSAFAGAIDGLAMSEEPVGESETDSTRSGIADCIVDPQPLLDRRRFSPFSDEVLMAHEDASEVEAVRSIRRDSVEEWAASRMSAADLRRVVGALRLDGVDRPKDEIESVLAAFVASEPTVSEAFARRSRGAPDAFGEVDATAWRSLPDDIARENAFHASRMQTLRGAFDLPEPSAAAAVLSLERMGYLLGRSDAAVGRTIPDDILAIATKAGIGVDDQRSLLVTASPAIDALAADLPAFVERFRDAALQDERAELAARAAFKARTGEEEGRMDVVERGGPVDEARGARVSEVRLALARVFLDAVRAIDIDRTVSLRFSLRIVESLSGCRSSGSMDASRTIRVLRAVGEDAALDARLDRCEQVLLEEPLAGLPPIAGAGADMQAHDVAWKAWWERWCVNGPDPDGLLPFTPGRRARATDAEGRRMLLMLQAVDGAPSKRRLQGIIAIAFEMELGRLRQSPFVEFFTP